MALVTMNNDFALWAARPEVQAAARQFIIDRSPDTERATRLVEKLESYGPPFGRGMNFGVIEAMNDIFWMHHSGDGVAGIGSRGDFNALAMQNDVSEWKKVFAIFAWSIGFRPEGDLAAPVSGSPMLQVHADCWT